MAFGSWPFSHPPAFAKLSKLGHQVSQFFISALQIIVHTLCDSSSWSFCLVQTENKIVYGHTLHVGTGAGQYSAGGLVTQLAFGGKFQSTS